jgi:hypothetical protein
LLSQGNHYTIAEQLLKLFWLWLVQVRVKGHEVTEENGEFLYSVEIEESLDKL